MKKAIVITLACVLLTLFTGCRRVSHNGDLDGFWRVKTVERITPDGEETTPIDNMFLCVECELLQIQTENSIVTTGVITYNEGAGKLIVDFKGSNSGSLATLGIVEDPVTFKVDVSGKHLMLSNSATVITCTKF